MTFFYFFGHWSLLLFLTKGKFSSSGPVNLSSACKKSLLITDSFIVPMTWIYLYNGKKYHEREVTVLVGALVP